jgi:hypothetical protein
MADTKTLADREKELQTLLATSEGKKELEKLADRYGAASGRIRSGKASIITYIIVHERQRGLISG